MRNVKAGLAAAGGALGAAVVMACWSSGMPVAQAQQDAAQFRQNAPFPQGPPPGGGFPGGRPNFGNGGGPPMGMGMPMAMPVQMIANDKYVYVLRGNTLFQVEAGTMKVRESLELPHPQMPPPHDGGGN